VDGVLMSSEWQFKPPNVDGVVFVCRQAQAAIQLAAAREGECRLGPFGRRGWLGNRWGGKKRQDEAPQLICYGPRLLVVFICLLGGGRLAGGPGGGEEYGGCRRPRVQAPRRG